MHIGEKEDGRRQKQRGRQGDARCEQGATETVDPGKGEQPGEPGQGAYRQFTPACETPPLANRPPRDPTHDLASVRTKAATASAGV